MPKYKLVCFDVDGTLIDNLQYSWQIFHDYFKTNMKKREKARSDFFSGKISYLRWAQHDIGMWISLKKKKKDFLEALGHSGIKKMAGADETIRALKAEGIKLAIISGSLNIVLEYIFPNYREIFDDVFLSKIHFNQEGYIERTEVTEFDMAQKATALKNIAKRENITLKECAFLGDHNNDVEIAKEAGLGIAFNCSSDALRKVADVVIEKKDLREILRYIL